MYLLGGRDYVNVRGEKRREAPASLHCLDIVRVASMRPGFLHLQAMGRKFAAFTNSLMMRTNHECKHTIHPPIPVYLVTPQAKKCYYPLS